MKIFIGSLSYNVTEGDWRQVFKAFGQVTSTSVAPMDLFTPLMRIMDK
jgi:RNA recognition motif-containing protein